MKSGVQREKWKIYKYPTSTNKPRRRTSIRTKTIGKIPGWKIKGRGRRNKRARSERHGKTDKTIRRYRTAGEREREREREKNGRRERRTEEEEQDRNGRNDPTLPHGCRGRDGRREKREG